MQYLHSRSIALSPWFCRNLKIATVSISSECYKTEIERRTLSTVSEEQVLVRSRAVVSRVVGGETLIVPIRGKVGDLASIYSFNETGSLVWRLLETPRILTELVAAVAQEYNVEHPRAEQDVKQFVSDMLSVGLVEVPNSVTVAGTEGPVGREGLTAAGA
jgi:hypothetical protein